MATDELEPVRVLEVTYGIDTLTFAFNWGPRAIPLEQCANDVIQFLNLLKQLVPPLKRWAVVSDDGEFLPVKIGAPAIRRLLQEGINYTDFTPKYPILELGYTLELSCRSRGWDDWSVRFECAGYTPAVPNSCVLECEDIEQFDTDTLASIEWRDVASLFVDVWNPDHGALETPATFDLGPLAGPAMRIGWITYISRSMINDLPPFPSHVMVDPVDERGWLIVALSENFPAYTKGDLDRLKKTHQALRDAFSGARRKK